MPGLLGRCQTAAEQVGQAPLQLYTVDPHTGAARPLSGGTFDGDVTYWTLSFGADGQAMVATVGTVWLMTLEYRS